MAFKIVFGLLVLDLLVGSLFAFSDNGEALDVGACFACVAFILVCILLAL